MLVALIAALAFMMITAGQAAFGLFDAQAGSGGSTSSDAASTWVVQPGETLWSIAEKVAPNTDPRETVARIVAMNDLPDAAVAVGQEIYVPA
ncbi:MAG: LysM peptidoglycan-binding domain-containing protein [Actinomycetes bacterium]